MGPPRLRLMTLLAWAATVCVPLGWFVAGCSSKTGGSLPLTSLLGMLRTYSDEPAAGVPLQLSGVPGSSRVDGVFFLGPTPSGSQVLRVGDSLNTPTVLVPVQISGTTQLRRPVHLPALDSGLVATLPAAITTTTTVSGDALPGVTLGFSTGTAISLPSGTSQDVRVLGISPSRLPATLPSGLAPRVAFLIEPHGATFTPAATLTIPRLDAATAGPFDAYQVSLTTGQWELIQSGVPLVGDSFQVTVTRGTMVCVVPRTPPGTVTITGRIVGGTQPVAGFRASCWNLSSDPTDADGTFQIQNVPSHFGAYLVRVYPSQPGAANAATVEQTVSLTPTLGDVSADVRPADRLRPSVTTTSPADAAVNVNQASQIVVTFSEPIDASNTTPFRVVDSRGTVNGRLNFDSPFQVRLVPAQRLRTSERHTIVVDPDVRDLSGNAIDDSRLAFVFTTRSGAPDPAPTDTLAFGISPLRGAKGDTISITGRNFTGGSTVSFGGTQGLVLSETADEIRVSVPDFQPAGDVTLTLSAGGTNVSTLRPLVLDLRPSVARIYSGTTPDTPLVALDRAMPPAAIVVDGANVGGGQVTIDGVSIAAVDSTITVASQTVTSGRTISVATPAPATLLTGPVVVRGSNGGASPTYRFLQVRE